MRAQGDLRYFTEEGTGSKKWQGYTKVTSPPGDSQHTGWTLAPGLSSTFWITLLDGWAVAQKSGLLGLPGPTLEL